MCLNFDESVVASLLVEITKLTTYFLHAFKNKFYDSFVYKSTSDVLSVYAYCLLNIYYTRVKIYEYYYEKSSNVYNIKSFI